MSGSQIWDFEPQQTVKTIRNFQVLIWMNLECVRFVLSNSSRFLRIPTNSSIFLQIPLDSSRFIQIHPAGICSTLQNCHHCHHSHTVTIKRQRLQKVFRSQSFSFWASRKVFLHYIQYLRIQTINGYQDLPFPK